MGTLSIFAVILLCSAAAIGQSALPQLADFSALSGCWERRDDAKKMFVSEQWMAPAGTSILGMGRTVNNGKTVDFEFMRIEERPDGIFFVARPAANTGETSFQLKNLTKIEATFENPDHDFPQRVIYRWTANSLTGRIEGTRKGKSTGIDFPFTRVKCV